MAIRKRPGTSGVSYQVYFNHPVTGKRLTKTFKDIKEARKYEAEMKYRLDHERESFETKQDKAKVAVKKAGRGSRLTFEQVTLLYLKEKEFSDSHNTRFLSSMARIFNRIGHICIEELQAAHFKNLLSALLKEKSMRHKKDVSAKGKNQTVATVSTAYVHGQMSKLRTVMRWAHENDFIKEVPAIRLPQPNYRRTVPPTPEEIDLILAESSPHLKRAIILGAALGVRVGPSELLALQWSNVDLITGLVRIDTSHKNPNFPWREIPIRDDLIPLFTEWRSEDEKMGLRYVIHYRKRPVGSIQTAWEATLKRAGIERRIRPYDLRHAFATQLIAAGTDVGTVAELMGHSSPAMIFKHYQHVLTKQKKKAVENLPVFFSCAKSMCQIENQTEKSVHDSAAMCQGHVPNKKGSQPKL